MGSITALGTPLANTANASTYATGSFTPTAGRQLFAWVAVTDAIPAAPTLTDTSNNNGLTFTQVGRAHKINTSNSTQEGELYLFVADQVTPASPAAMTLTISGVTGASGCFIMPGEVASLTRVGISTVRQFGVAPDVQGGTAPSVTLAANVLTTNPIAFGALVSVATGSTPPTGMTERADVNYSTPTSGAEWASRDSGSTATTFALGGTGNGPCCAIAVEFDSSGFSGTASLSGSGSLAAAGSPAAADVAALSGTGSLSAAATPGETATAALSGTGSLNAAGTPTAAGTAALSGSGTLTEAGSPKTAGVATLTGDGTLTTSGTPQGRDVAALSGDGTLSTTFVPSPTGAAALSGEGTLSLVGRDLTARKVHVRVVELNRRLVATDRSRDLQAVELGRTLTVIDRS